MPFSISDVDKHKKGLSESQKKQWVAVANSALKSCMDKGGNDASCAPGAIKQANGVMKKRMSEMGDKPNTDPEGVVVSSTENTDTAEMRYPRYADENTPGWFDAMSFADFDAAKHAKRTEEKLQERTDQFFTLFWRIWNNDEIPFGQKQARWQSLFAEFMDVLDEVRARDNDPDNSPDDDYEEVDYQFAESSFGHVEIVEDNVNNNSKERAPLVMEVEIIQPGFGNKRDNHYYTTDVLKRDAHVFKGVKMYATNHRENERSELTEVSIIDDIVGFSENGAPIASVTVFDPQFAEKTRNRNKAGKLDTLECSILASGRAKKGEINGKSANIVEAITKAHAVDWVTSAGAGGKARRLVENNQEVDGMEDTQELNANEQEAVETTEVEEQEVEIREAEEAESTETEEETSDGETEEVAESEPVLLTEAQVTDVLNSYAKLPAAIYKRISKGKMVFENEDALKEFVNDELEYIKELTGSGQPLHSKSNQSKSGQVDPISTLEERRKTMDAVNKKHGFVKSR